MTNIMPLPSATAPLDKTWAMHMCMHADINKTEVGFVILISGDLRLGRSVKHFQDKQPVDCEAARPLAHLEYSQVLSGK